MRSKKTAAELDWQTSSSMRWADGEEVVAYLDWDERCYYLWFEPSLNFTVFCEEIDREDFLANLENELAKIGVQEFYSLEDVNEYCKEMCGSYDPYDRAEFYEDELLGVCGA